MLSPFTSHFYLHRNSIWKNWKFNLFKCSNLKVHLHPQNTYLIWSNKNNNWNLALPTPKHWCDSTWLSFILLLQFEVSYTSPSPSSCPNDSIPQWHLTSLKPSFSLFFFSFFLVALGSPSPFPSPLNCILAHRVQMPSPELCSSYSQTTSPILSPPLSYHTQSTSSQRLVCFLSY